MKPLTARLRSLLPALLLLSLPACADPDTAPAGSGFFEGRVLEAGTNKPIPGAIVLARWTEVRSAWVDSQDVCVHVETTTSDADGRFRLPRYRGRNPTLFDSYKAGYEEAGYNLTEADARHESWLKRSTARRGERLKYLARIAVSCSDNREIEMKLLPLYKALYEEAKSIAVTREEKITALHHLKDIEKLELGSTQAWKNFHQREREVK